MTHPSLLDAIHDVLALSSPPASEAHLFSSRSSSISSRLQSILDTTSQLNYALTQLSAMPPSNQTSKLVSLMKQHTAISASIAISRAAVTGLSSADRSVVFPDHAPPSPNRVAEWGRAAGMEAFVDIPRGSSVSTIMLAGKVLVLDIDIEGRILVKTSFAVGNNVPNGTAVAPDLDAFLAREVSRWVEAAKYASSGESSPSMGEPAVVAADCARTLLGHMRYFVMLDSLAASEGERGIRWFMEPSRRSASIWVGSTATLTRLLLKQRDRSKVIPLDKLLVQRAFPILYLNFPSLSFLVWLSPLAYLHLRSSMPKHVRGATGQADIPLSHMTTSLFKDPNGTTLASLKLVPSSEVLTVGGLSEGQNDHAFPSSPSHSWILEFTRSPFLFNGRDGIVMSQTRMQAIQSFLGVDVATDILMSIGTPAGASVNSGLGGMGSFGSMSQLNFNNFSTSQTTGAHPPLNLRLSVPQEPGFLLQRVPVRTTNQVSRVLEIVREQCWLNELLLMSQWQPEDTAVPLQDPTAIDPPSSSTGGTVANATELLASLLEGSLTPRSIPVSVFLPSTSLPPLAHMGMDFGGSVSPLRQTPMIILSSPAKAPATGLVELRVSFVPGSSNGAGIGLGNGGGDCGVKVEASPGIDTKGMDEIVRRGGIWGLPGRVWTKNHK
ncbi:hypothetical protein EV401DRAFT_1846272 [Pisolithus croceorrhizus]|nr:hypothetical protein EV401DRAFT_1846272 [Pisolithus croceorrhizus]